MYKVILEVKINNAKDRDAHRYYRKAVKLALPPFPGSKIRLGKRSILVAGYSQAPVSQANELPIIELEKQNQTFKGASFENLCRAFEDLGFKAHVDGQVIDPIEE